MGFCFGFALVKERMKILFASHHLFTSSSFYQFNHLAILHNAFSINEF